MRVTIKSVPSFCNDSLYVLLHNNVLKCLIYSIAIDIVLPKIGPFLPSIANTEKFKDFFCCSIRYLTKHSSHCTSAAKLLIPQYVVQLYLRKQCHLYFPETHNLPILAFHIFKPFSFI